ncbi:MAG: citrate lyase subunit beta / citryl-CoA lyase [Thermoplasmata archaeon]|nr:citrate lyase subunit beta / citryl-CoA lyase [Thermoplasmata archaeon]
MSQSIPRPGAAPKPRLRSVLYTPGDRGDRLEKALRDGAADLILADLEDAVAPERKAEARRQVAAAFLSVPAGAKGTLRGVRINAWPGQLANDDLAAVMALRPDVLAVPKCEDAKAMAALAAQLDSRERGLGLAHGSTRLLVILETAAGILAARELAAASPRVIAVAFGAEDLAADAGLRRSASNAEVAVPRALVALAAAAAKVPAIDMITADPKDVERTRREALEARALGFQGKMCIHPAQVAAVHEAFRPTSEEVAAARRVVDAVAKAGIAAGGVVVVDGRMVDVPFVEQANRTLRDAEP